MLSSLSSLIILKWSTKVKSKAFLASRLSEIIRCIWYPLVSLAILISLYIDHFLESLIWWMPNHDTSRQALQSQIVSGIVRLSQPSCCLFKVRCHIQIVQIQCQSNYDAFQNHSPCSTVSQIDSQLLHCPLQSKDSPNYQYPCLL